MIEINIDPIVARWGGLALGWHGLWLVAGIVVAYRTVVAAGRREGLSPEHLAELMVWACVAGYAAARLFYVVDHWQIFSADPRRIFAVGRGGLSILGGLLGGTAAGFVFVRRKQLSFWRLADVVAIGIPVGELVGRVGCAINGDTPGVVTGGGWGFVYRHPGAEIPAYLLGKPTFPAPLALQLWSAGLLVLVLAGRRRRWQAGSLFLATMLGYGVGRALISTWQVGEPFLFGLKQAQVVGLALAAACAAGLAYRRRAGNRAKKAGGSATGGTASGVAG